MADTKRFKLDLFQQARVHTESFVVDAKDPKDAQSQADKIAKDKGLKDGFEWEVNETNDAAAAPVPEPEPTEPEVR